jgi:hypothetical protein
MKKIYTLLVIMLAAIAANAQCTPDNTLTQPGYYPEQLDTADVGVAYSMVLQLRIPPDTNAVVLGQPVKADIDSIKLVSVKGMPAGFTYQCNVPTCTFVPHQTYCAVLQGNPTAAQSGTYPLKLAIVAYAHGVIFGTPTTFPPQPDTIRRFTLVVGNGVFVTVEETQQPREVKLYPNPATKEVNILLNGEAGESISYELCDIAGKVIKQAETTLDADYAIATLPLDDVSKGIYFVRASSAKGTTATRLVVE